MNYHFTTTKAHIRLNGGDVVELITDAGLQTTSDLPFKGDMDIDRLEALIAEQGADKIAFVRIEAGTNLIGGQPVSLQNMTDVRRVCDQHGLLLVMDASLLADNLHFIKTREASCRDLSIREVTRKIADLCDIMYFSARKLGCVRGGGICIRTDQTYRKLRGPRAALRGLPHLRGHVGARDRGPRGGPRGDHGRGHGQPRAAVHRLHGR